MSHLLYSLIIFCSLIFVIHTDFDPDVLLCDDRFIDAAVMADDGQSEDLYVLKGSHYWKANVENGITHDYGKPIADKWPGLPTDLDGAFNIFDKEYRFSTVFIKGKNWFLFNGNKLVKKGKTSIWKYFPKNPIDAVLTYRYAPTGPNTFSIYFMSGEDFVKYQILNITNAVLEDSGKLVLENRWIGFLAKKRRKAGNNMRRYLSLTAAVSNTNRVIFFGVGNYCIASISSYPKCQFLRTGNFFHCPRKESETIEPTIHSTTTRVKNTKNTAKSTAKSLLPGVNSGKPVGSIFTDNVLLITVITVILIIILIATLAVIFLRKKKNSKNSTHSESESEESMHSLQSEDSDHSIDKNKKTTKFITSGSKK